MSSNAIRIVAAAVAMLALSAQSVFAGDSWDPQIKQILAHADGTPSLPCSAMVSADGSATGNTLAFLTWFFGYRDGLAALAKIDGRLKALPQVPPVQLGAMFLTYCRNKQSLPLGEAATGVFELTLNAQPGSRFDLRVPGQ